MAANRFSPLVAASTSAAATSRASGLVATSGSTSAARNTSTWNMVMEAAIATPSWNSVRVRRIDTASAPTISNSAATHRATTPFWNRARADWTWPKDSWASATAAPS